MAFNNVEDLILALVPMRRRFVSGLRDILQDAKPPASVGFVYQKRHIYSEDIESRL
jgi:hypothetical protein